MVLLSEDALRSLWVNREINAALSLESRPEGLLIVPAVVAPCSIPPILSGYRRLNFTAGHDPVAELRSFAQIVNEGITPQPPPTPPPSERTKHTSTASNRQTSPREPTYSIGSISSGTLNVNMGENIFVTHNYGISSSPDAKQDPYFLQSTALVDDFSKQSARNTTVTDGRLTIFLDMTQTMRTVDMCHSPA